MDGRYGDVRGMSGDALEAKIDEKPGNSAKAVSGHRFRGRVRRGCPRFKRTVQAMKEGGPRGEAPGRSAG